MSKGKKGKEECVSRCRALDREMGLDLFVCPCIPCVQQRSARGKGLVFMAGWLALAGWRSEEAIGRLRNTLTEYLQMWEAHSVGRDREGQLW